MIHCTTCTSIGRCEDAVRNGYVIRCIYFGELSRQASFTISDPEETCKKGYDDIECGLAKCWAFKAKPGNIQTKFPKNDLEI